MEKQGVKKKKPASVLPGDTVYNTTAEPAHAVSKRRPLADGGFIPPEFLSTFPSPQRKPLGEAPEDNIHSRKSGAKEPDAAEKEKKKRKKKEVD